MIITIKLDAIREIAYVGIRRAAIFLGFSINCIKREDCNEFDLSNYSMYHYLPNDITNKLINEYKMEYEKWIIANAFSELVNSFEVYLNAIFEAVAYVGKPSTKVKDSFLKNGISTKLSILNKAFGIEINLMDSFETINKARNCLYHRRGVVSKRDIDSKSNKLSIKWLGLDIQYEKENGDIVNIETPVIDTYVVGKGKNIFVTQNERKKVFQINEQINFSVKELSEICYHFNIEVDDIYMNVINYYKRNGIEITQES